MTDLTINGVVPGAGDCPVTMGDRMCRAVAGGGMLMCRSHWRAVPPPIQRQVYVAAARYNAHDATLRQLRGEQRAAVEAVSR